MKFFVEILLRIEVEVIMLFPLVEELRLHLVFTLLKVVSNLELLNP